MGIRDMLKKKDRFDHEYSDEQHAAVDRLAGPEFTFIRSDTHTQEVIYPPPSPIIARDDAEQYLSAKDSSGSAGKSRRSLDVFKTRSRGSSLSSAKSSDHLGAKKDTNLSRRLSHRLHLSRAPSTSEYVPENLPTIKIGDGDVDGDAGPDKEAREREWEKRATILAARNEQTLSRSASISPSPGRENVDPFDMQAVNRSLQTQSNSDGAVSSKTLDDDIQEAIRLHEEGHLEQSTAIFGRLADPHGNNNPLSQVLYGLALRYVNQPTSGSLRNENSQAERTRNLFCVQVPSGRLWLTMMYRHGWGCEPDVAKAVSYLSLAASNAAEVENLALKAGLKKGGAAKGELVLAMFELANCFRQGWGVPKDAVAAKNVGSPK